MMLVIVRALLVLALPFVLIGAFFEELIICFWRAFIYAWLNVRSEFASFRWAWRDAPNQIKQRKGA